MDIEARLIKNYSLSQLSTWGIGGEARFFIEVHTEEEMGILWKWIQRTALPFWIVGRGSNSLFDDRGFDGLIILNRINFFRLLGTCLHVGAGYSFSLLGHQLVRLGLSGLEFAAGIPGSVGGAIYMNAGAHGMDTQSVLDAVYVIDEEGVYREKKKSHLQFGYRFSSFHVKQDIIVSGKFVLKKCDQSRKKQLALIGHRMKTQPYRAKSAGCVFRNIADMPAAILIERCGLKGKSIGGAEISSLHANFIINRGGATALNVLELISLVKQIVKQKTGYDLKTEVKCVPYQLEH